MKTKSRIASIIEAHSLDASVTGFQPFRLSELALVDTPTFELPTNIRLGHLAEKIVAGLITASTNYTVLYENVQIQEANQTIGEIDFIIENTAKKELIHVELAYKFYLFDPSISTEPMHNWIGPNKNDSLREKLVKLKRKQFPLLYHSCTLSKLHTIDISTISQKLCLLVSLFIPYNYKTKLSPAYTKAIKGYYVSLEQFMSLHDSEKTYYIPSKKEWGMEASENEIWVTFDDIAPQMMSSLQEKQAILCWQKQQETYVTFFIVWW